MPSASDRLAFLATGARHSGRQAGTAGAFKTAWLVAGAAAVGTTRGASSAASAAPAGAQATPLSTFCTAPQLPLAPGRQIHKHDRFTFQYQKCSDTFSSSPAHAASFALHAQPSAIFERGLWLLFKADRPSLWLGTVMKLCLASTGEQEESEEREGLMRAGRGECVQRVRQDCRLACVAEGKSGSSLNRRAWKRDWQKGRNTCVMLNGRGAWYEKGGNALGEGGGSRVGGHGSTRRGTLCDVFGFMEAEWLDGGQGKWTKSGARLGRMGGQNVCIVGEHHGRAWGGSAGRAAANKGSIKMLWRDQRGVAKG